MCCGNAGWQGRSLMAYGSNMPRQGGRCNPGGGDFPGFGNEPGCCKEKESQDINRALLGVLLLLLGVLLGGRMGARANLPGGGLPDSPLFDLPGGSPFGGSGAGFSGHRGGGGNAFGGAEPVNLGRFSPGQGPGNGNVLDVARSYLGLNERQHGSFINRTFSKGQNRPWCADFVSTVLQQSGGSPWGHIAWVPGIHKWAVRNNRLTNQPRPGDVILLRGTRGNLGHTGFVEKIENGYVYTIEGNASDSVKRRRYRLDSPNVQGFVSTGQAGQMTA